MLKDAPGVRRALTLAGCVILAQFLNSSVPHKAIMAVKLVNDDSHWFSSLRPLRV